MRCVVQMLSKFEGKLVMVNCRYCGGYRHIALFIISWAWLSLFLYAGGHDEQSLEWLLACRSVAVLFGGCLALCASF